MRRDFVECAAGQVRLTGWCQGWIERIASIYRLNGARLEHHDPGRKRQTPAFDAAQGALKEALDGLFAEAELELSGLPDEAREGKALRSLLNHREGLSVFVDRPQVPLDNNRAERFLRGPAIGRRLSFGSDSVDGARFTAIMYSVVGTLSMNDIDVLRWLDAWLAACAENDRKPPVDLSSWRVLFRTLFDGGFSRLFRAVDAQISHIILALPDRGTAFDGAFPARLMKARGDRFAKLVGM